MHCDKAKDEDPVLSDDEDELVLLLKQVFLFDESLCLSVCLSFCLSVFLSVCLSVCLSLPPLWHISTHKSVWFFRFQIPPPKRRRSSLFPAKAVLTPKVIAPRYRLRSSAKVSTIEKMKCCVYVALLLLILNDNVKTPAVN